MTQAATLSPTPFGRVVTAMVTPFDASSAVDLSVAANLARHLAVSYTHLTLPTNREV